MEKIEYLYKVYSKHFATVNFEYLSREEFINKIKTDDEFAKTWGISKSMGNIHVLSKDKPSRLQKLINYEIRKFELCDKGDFFSKGVQIYITSDGKIKEGDWYIVNGVLIHKKTQYLDSLAISKREIKKIILTTDQDLIKDGVQAIDDEFLEWFVQNPSYEEVEVNKMRYGYLSGYADAGYKIIIPKKNFYCGDKFDYDEQCEFQCENCVNKKGVDYGYLPKEEPKKVLTEEDIFNQKDIDAVTDYINKEQQKQHLIDMMKSDEELELYDEDSPAYNHQARLVNDLAKEIKLEDIFNDEKKENIKKFIDEIKNPSEPNQLLKDAAQKYMKQETLEEVAEIYAEPYRCPATNDNEYCKHDIISAFNNGAKWQQEKSYSEEDMIEFGFSTYCYISELMGVPFNLISENRLNAKDWFEQFKKK